MDPVNDPVLHLEKAADAPERSIGGKARQLGRLIRLGYRVPPGFVIPVSAYHDFLDHNGLRERIDFELGRKRFEDMRWEEMWDAALRIRSAFARGEMPRALAKRLSGALRKWKRDTALAVRSSAPGEDSGTASFAGLHESVVDIRGEAAFFHGIRRVWASLWSDAALLYRRELGLDPFRAGMAVVVQELVVEGVSGVAFARDPADFQADQARIEAVPGLCRDLVNGSLEPDGWILNRSEGGAVKKEWRRNPDASPLLDPEDIRIIYEMLTGIEKYFGWPPDTEWTGRKDRFTLLQARPVTAAGEEKKDEKARYLALRPGENRLRKLASTVSGELIPRLRDIGERLSREDLEAPGDRELSRRIREREELLKEWGNIYRDYFIPFAHGVRYLGTYYNDAVKPRDPYEFVGLLKGQNMISLQRNRRMEKLAEELRRDRSLKDRLAAWSREDKSWGEMEEMLGKGGRKSPFVSRFREFVKEYMDVSLEGVRLYDHPRVILSTLFELTGRKSPGNRREDTGTETEISKLEKKFYQAVGKERKGEAGEVLRIGRLSWKLRDDDNLLMGRLESQLIRALDEGARRLRRRAVLTDSRDAGLQDGSVIAGALESGTGSRIALRGREKPPPARDKGRGKPRQLVGQPAARGLATGIARIIRDSGDIGHFRDGEILVCDAIQPNMTHLVPLARGIVERRGGMLIHGAIIARELGIPCVNGIAGATEGIGEGETVTVDGNLGIVTVGAAEFDLELNPAAGSTAPPGKRGGKKKINPSGS